MVKGEGFRRPESPTSTLPRGMDNLIKRYFDSYRRRNLLPPEISSIIKGRLVEEDAISKWRNWRTGLTFVDNDGSKLLGALDECVVVDGVYIPIDYKTRGYDLKEDSTSYYTFQMSCYNFLLNKNGYKVSDSAYLVFYIPLEFQDEGVVHFNIEVKRVKTFPLEKVYSVFRNALSILSQKNPPEAGKSCKFCSWAFRVTTLE